MRGKFLTLEGIDGAGKTTQALRLASYLEEHGERVESTREPGGTGLGEGLRTLLLQSDYQVNAWAEAFLYAAARAQLAADFLKPLLATGVWVISDRYFDSSLAYQGYGRNLPIDALRELQVLARFPRPDLTLVLDVYPEKALARARGRTTSPDRFEKETLDFFNCVRQGYLELASMEPERIKVVSAFADEETTWSQIKILVDAILRRE